VAFIDADCRAAPDWIENIIKAHDSPHLAIGGTISNGNPESKVGWAAYFTEFSKWMPGTPRKMMSDIAGANISYKIEIFHEYGRFIQGTYCSDTEFNWRIGRDGYQLQFEPTIMVYHSNIEHLSRFIRHEIFHGLSFARVRIRAHSFSTAKRIIYAICSPLIAIKLIVEIGKNTLCRRFYFKQFFRNLGLIVLGVFCWCAGETVGYLEKKR
jgi:GT2 family glycosyltransferase